MARGLQVRAPLPVQVTQPLIRRSALGEGLPYLQPVRQGREGGVVITRLRVRFGQLRHGEQGGVGAAGADIVALDRHRRGQDDVRVPRGGGPERVVHHHGLRPGERLTQPGEVLVVVERVPAAPVDELDIRVAAALPVVVVAGAGMQQHVRDPGHRDVGVDAVGALGQARRGHPAGVPDVAARPVAVPEPAARQADLAEHRGQHQAQPDRLFPVLGPLQRPADRDQRAPGRHLAGQRADPVGRDAGQGGRPLRGLRHAVSVTAHIAPRTAGNPPCTGPGSGDRRALRSPGRGRARASARRRCRAPERSIRRPGWRRCRRAAG